LPGIPPTSFFEVFLGATSIVSYLFNRHCTYNWVAKVVSLKNQIIGVFRYIIWTAPVSGGSSYWTAPVSGGSSYWTTPLSGGSAY
jgi:hypothetical protein